jgi:hypothetical protein
MNKIERDDDSKKSHPALSTRRCDDFTDALYRCPSIRRLKHLLFCLQPGDYLSVQTTFAYAPLFSGITVAGKFPTPIVKTAMMRLG